jgi:hypothetical protein
MVAECGNSSVDNFVAEVSSRFNKVQHSRLAKLLKIQEGKRALTWSRTRFDTLLKLVEFCCFELIQDESFAALC